MSVEVDVCESGPSLCRPLARLHRRRGVGAGRLLEGREGHGGDDSVRGLLACRLRRGCSKLVDGRLGAAAR